MGFERMIDRTGDAVTVRRVFGEPIERDGLTIIPVARLRGGFGGGQSDRADGAPEGAMLSEGPPVSGPPVSGPPVSASPVGGPTAGLSTPSDSPVSGSRPTRPRANRLPGGWGGGAAWSATPAGAYVIKGGEVRWVAATNEDRTVLLGCSVAVVALLVFRSIVRAVTARGT